MPSKEELLKKCKLLGIRGYSSKTKQELIALLDKYDDESRVTRIEPEPEPTENSIRFVDLFCGIGGFHQAIKKIGGQCVFACDIDEDCRKMYEANYGIKPAPDITQIDIPTIPSFDVLCGGFPCQPFSKAGYQKGFEDNRGNLFFNICEIVEYHRPKYIILENVRNLSSHDNGNTWKVICENIDRLGYYTYPLPTILNVLHFNIPQNRERVIIMCKRKDLGELQELPPIPIHPKTRLTKKIEDFCDNDPILIGKYKITGKLKSVERVWDDFLKILIRNNIPIPKFPLWTDWWDNTYEDTDAFYIKYTSWINKNREFYANNIRVLEPWLLNSRKNPHWLGAVRKFEWQAGDLLENDGMHNVLWTSRGSGIRVKRCDYIPTLVAMSMVPIYGKESRMLTPTELLRLQSFPTEGFIYNEKKIYKQLGNAVNVTMIERCARFLILGEPLL